MPSWPPAQHGQCGMARPSDAVSALPGAIPKRGENLAQRMQSRLASLSPAINVRLAACPRDGTTVQTLFSACAQPVPGSKRPIGATNHPAVECAQHRRSIRSSSPTRLCDVCTDCWRDWQPVSYRSCCKGKPVPAKSWLAAAAVHHFSSARSDPLSPSTAPRS